MLYTQAPKYHDIHSHDPDHNCMFHNEANGYWMQVVIKPASTDCLGSFKPPPPQQTDNCECLEMNKTIP